MRGWKEVINGAVFIGALLGAATSALAQQDPQVTVTWNNASVPGPNGSGTVTLSQVTLSRTDLPTLAAYDLTITNNTTNALNRLYFTVTITNNGSDNGTVNTIYYTSPAGSRFDCSANGSSTLTCTSGGVNSPTTGISLDPNTGYITQKVTVVVNAPTKGSQLTATVAAGGYEGNSLSGQGCCAYTRTAYTSLIDATNDTTLTYTLNAITFVNGQPPKDQIFSRIFTGNKGVASTSDPFATDVNVPAFTSAQYDIGTLQETNLGAPAGSNCRNGNRFKTCYSTSVSLPNVFYVDATNPLSAANICSRADALQVVLRIDSSLIKGNPTPDLSLIQVRYTPDGGSQQQVSDCSVASGLPCICSRYQYIKGTPGGLLSYSNDLKNDIELVIRNYKNGSFVFD